MPAEHRPNEGSRGALPILTRLDAPRTAERTRLAVVADPHVTAEAKGTWKVYHRTVERLRTAVADINRRDVTAVLLAGDLTKDGAVSEFETADRLLADLQPPLVGVPGNHDVPKPRWDSHPVPSVERFAQQYGRGQYPFVTRVGGVDVVAVNSASCPDGSLADTHTGAVGETDRLWLERTLPELETPLVLLHHNVHHPRTHTGSFPEGEFYQVRNPSALRRTLVRGEAALAVSGHIHWPAVGERDGLRELIAPAVCSFPQAYLLLDIGPRGTTVRFVPLATRRELLEAYMHAHRGNEHGRGIATWVDADLLDDLLETTAVEEKWTPA